MRTFAYRFISMNRALLTNAGSLVSTTVVTSALGFVYWWLAARRYPPAAVGLASAAVSAMLLLGSISVLGMGTLLMGELPRQREKAPALLTTALIVAALAGGVLGLVFAYIMPLLSAELGPLSGSPWSALLFALGVSLTTVTLVLDQALIGLMRGGLQLWRNFLFAAVKLVILWAVSFWLADRLGLSIYATWVSGILVSLVFLVLMAIRRGMRRGIPLNVYRPQWRLLHKLGRTAIVHHFLNIALQIPNLALPVLVPVLLSATANAHFYAAWMIASFVFVGPLALTTALYAASAANQDAVARQVRHTLGLSLVVGIAANVALLFGANDVLRLFGQSYTDQAGLTLRIVSLGVFPLIIRNHYVAISRVYARMSSATRVTTLGGVLELALAAAGAKVAGLEGLSIGWVCAVCIEAVLMGPVVYRAAFTTSQEITLAHSTSSRSSQSPSQLRHRYTRIDNGDTSRQDDADISRLRETP